MDKLSKLVGELKNRHFLLADALAFSFIPLIALAIRMDGAVSLDRFGTGLITVTPTFVFIKILIFYTAGMYRRYWRYASIDEVSFIGAITGLAIGLQIIVFIALYHINPLPFTDLPRSLPLIDGLLTFIYVGGIRFSIRLVERQNERGQRGKGVRTLVIGAGSAGMAIVSEMQRNLKQGLRPVALIDDSPAKHGLKIRGIYVVGDRSKIAQTIQLYKIKKIVIAMPSASGKDIREIVNICSKHKITINIIPSIGELINGKVKIEKLRDVQVEDLLRREPVQTDSNKVSEYLYGKRVLVTGAGGSIGSEICRQIISFRPAEIILLGHGENSIFEMEHELRKVIQLTYRDGNGKRNENEPRIFSFIADIRQQARLKTVFENYKPDIIFHAAAHKHVPLMEKHPTEAITNNIIGTRNLLFLATRYNVENFVMISTDKAVNPTSIMGASKRVAEILLLQAAQRTGYRYVCVRFGNVLGSRGSVIPIFKNQIENGGPVVVTHPEVKRYFMTIPEAVQLVLQASVIGQGGEIFVLNMGQPIKIVDLAKDIIRLSGLELGKDIDIAYSGLRPGEKLFEELFVAGEEYVPTEHDKILIASNASQIIPEGLDTIIEETVIASQRNDEDLIWQSLQKLIPGFKIPETAISEEKIDNSEIRIRETSEEYLNTQYEPAAK